MKRLVARALIVVTSILGIVFAQVPLASAQASDELASNLAALWTRVLERPGPANPAAGHGAPCWELGHNTVAPFTFATQEPSCTVGAHTKLFVAGFTTECSTFDSDCDGDTDFGNCDATSADGLLDCARLRDSNKNPTVRVDGGDPVNLTEVETPPLNIHLPNHNIFDELGIPTPRGNGVSVAHGFVALLGPLEPGTHTIVFTGNFPTGTTTIIVKPGQ